MASSAYTYGVTSPSPQGNTVLPMPWSSFVATNPGLISGVPSFNISAISASTVPGTYSIPVGQGSLTSNIFDFTFAPASLTVFAIPKLGNLVQNVFDTNWVTLGGNRIQGNKYETWSRATGIASSADSNTVKETLEQILSSDGLGVTVVYGKTSYAQGRITQTMSSLIDAVNAVLRSQCPPCNPIVESTLSTWIYGS